MQRDLHYPIEQRIMDHAVDPDFSEYALGGFMYKGNFLTVLDIDKMVADEELSNAAAARVSSIKGKSND